MIIIKPVFSSTGTAGRVAVFDPSTGLLTASVVTTDELELLSGISGGDILTEGNTKTISNKTFNQDLVADANAEHDIGSSGVRWKDTYLSGQLNAATGDFSGNVTVGGNLTVNGTTTTLNTSTLDVEDTNITVNKGGNDASSEGAGLTVERTGPAGSLIYADASATKFRVGASGSEVDIVGTTSTQTLTNKTLVAASNTITTAASGNLAATELNAALAELQGDIDTRALDSDLDAHVGDATGAHAASAVSVVPTGNLAADDVQEALTELQGDVDALDTRLTTAEADVITAQAAADAAQIDIDNHLADTADAHNASAISVVATGNLAATDVQAALEELQADVDTRALDSDLDAHIGDSSGAHAASAISVTATGNLASTDVQSALSELQSDVDTRALDSDLDNHTAATSAHGVFGDVVGTSDAQTLTSKDIDGGTASNSNRITLPKNTKTNLDGLTRKEGTLVYATDTQKAYVDNGTALVAVGSGTGSGSGINLVTLDSSYTAGAEPNNFDFEDANEGVGTWAVYADAAATTPEDMTGGTPGTTLTRETTSELNGAASAKADLGTGSSRQGEGWSNLCYIPPAYRGRTLTFKFPYSITGTVVEDDLVPYAYDVTNSALIKPYVKSKLLGSSGVCECLVSVPSTCAQLRVGVHIARTSTDALSVIFDDVQLTPDSTPVGVAGSDWIAYTPTLTGFGTASSVDFWYRRIGDVLEIRGNFTSGTATATEARLSLPTGLVSDSNKTASQKAAGIYFRSDGGVTDHGGMVIIEPGVTYVTFGSPSAFSGNAVSARVKANGNSVAASGNVIDISSAIVPISGWSSNVTMAESSTFWISSYLANGTRVTSTPTKLGEYRTLIKNNAATTMTDTDGSGAVSATNGMLIYTVSGTGAGTAGQPNRWEIFVGKNKNVKAHYWASSGRTGVLNTTQGYENGQEYGVIEGYDPTTGVMVLAANIGTQSSSATRALGYTAFNGATAPATTMSGYFDIKVSENALAVGTQNPRSEVFVYGANGYGSINTKIRRYTTTSINTGAAITYSDSSTNGASFTINEDGVYAVTAIDNFTGAGWLGVSKNSNQLTTSILSITDSHRLGAVITGGAGWASCFSCTLNCVAGDVIRPHNDDISNGPNTKVTSFRITKVSN